MKDQKLMMVLVAIALLFSIASTIISIVSLRHNYKQDELLASLQVIQFDARLAEDQRVAREMYLQELDSLEAEKADSLQQKSEENKHPKHAHHNHKTTKSAEQSIEQTLHDHLLKIVAGEQYVDLGLPSGTMWKSENEEGLLDYKTAWKKYKRRMPSIKQWEELKRYCEWTWTGNGYQVIGPNGASIFMPAAGYRNFSGQIGKVGVFGNYWSSNTKDSEEAWRFGFESDKFSIATHSRKYGRSVRLVYKQIINHDAEE
jgi:hypothetical protein